MLAKANMLYKANYQNEKAAREDQGFPYMHTASKNIVDVNLFGFCEIDVITFYLYIILDLSEHCYRMLTPGEFFCLFVECLGREQIVSFFVGSFG